MPTLPAQPPVPPAPGAQPGARPASGRRPARRGRRVAGPPLPDPAAVRLRTVPDPAPPFDDELAPTLAATDHLRAWVQQQPPPGGQLTAPGQRPAGPGRPGAGSPAARPPGQAGRPAMTSQFAQALIESLAGTRPPRQLATWTTERAKSRIQRMGPLLTGGHRPQLRRVIAHRPAPDVIEMTLVVSFGTRTRALAVRLEHAPARPVAPGRPPRPGKWVCTDVEAA